MFGPVCQSRTSCSCCMLCTVDCGDGTHHLLAEVGCLPFLFHHHCCSVQPGGTTAASNMSVCMEYKRHWILTLCTVTDILTFSVFTSRQSFALPFALSSAISLPSNPVSLNNMDTAAWHVSSAHCSSSLCHPVTSSCHWTYIAFMSCIFDVMWPAMHASTPCSHTFLRDNSSST